MYSRLFVLFVLAALLTNVRTEDVMRELENIRADVKSRSFLTENEQMEIVNKIRLKVKELGCATYQSFYPGKFTFQSQFTLTII